MRPESSGRWHAFSLDVIPRLVVTAALGGFTVFYRPLADHPEPAHLRELSIGLVGVLAAISFVQALASVRSRPVDVALWVVAADGAVALAFGWLYSFDPRDLLLTPLLLVMVEAALNLSPRAALSAWALLSVGYAAREGWAQRLSGVEALPLSVVLRMGLGLLIVLVVAVHRAQRRRAERELAERAAWLASVVATHQAIATSELSLETVLTLVVERVQRLTNATAAIVELAEGQEMVYRSASGTASAHVGLRLDMDASLSGRAMTLNEVLVSTDTETDPRVDREACRQVRARSMAVVPFSHTGRAVGVLKVISPSPDAFGEQDVQTLQLMAGAIAAQVANATRVEQLVHDVLHDALTGLANMTLFMDRLERAIASLRRRAGCLAVVFIDLDHFKQVNDRMGHQVGSELLAGVGGRLRTVLRDTDTAARFGGDEFVLLCELTDPNEARLLADRLLGEFVRPFEIGGRPVEISASLGVATVSSARERPEEAWLGLTQPCTRRKVGAGTATSWRCPPRPSGPAPNTRGGAENPLFAPGLSRHKRAS